MWAYLPDVLLEDIFARLNLVDRYTASQVCRNWYRIFHSPRVWRCFLFTDRTLTRRRFNYYLGYQYILDHGRAQLCLHRMGRNIRQVVLEPVSNFFNLYEFMNMLSAFSEFFDENPLAKVYHLDFSFACHLATGDAAQDLIFGTGGKLLQALKRLMRNLTGLRFLALRNLLLERNEAMFLLDDIVQNCCEQLDTLVLLNCTKEPYPIMHCGVFLRIRTLVVSPQQLNEEVLLLLGYTKLRNLYIVQSQYTELAYPVAPYAWLECRKVSPKLRVHLVVEGKIKVKLIWQEGAPVRSIVHNSPYSRVTVESAMMAATLYPYYLEGYFFSGLPRFYMSKKFMDRGDSALVLLCRSCPNLANLVVRELVSTATVLLMATLCPKMRRFVVRRNAIIKRCDWPRNPEWTDDFHLWLKSASRSYETTAAEVSRILGYSWSPVSDQEFKFLRLPETTSWV